MSYQANAISRVNREINGQAYTWEGVSFKCPRIRAGRGCDCYFVT